MGNCRSKKKNDTENCEELKPNGTNSQPEATDVQHLQASSSIVRQVIGSTREEVNDLLGEISIFRGTSETDKNYRYLDEMLTRCILKLDNLECNNAVERGTRKHAIGGVNQAISILERKLEFNYDIKKLESNLTE